MIKRTTIEIDEALLTRAKSALRQTTTRATVEEALRRAADGADRDREQQAGRQQQFLARLGARVDLDLLASDDMWR